MLSSSITLGSQSAGIAVTPNGKYAYVTDTNIIQGFAGNTVSVINTATNTVLGSPITVGSGALGIAITPDGKYAYVANNHDAYGFGDQHGHEHGYRFTHCSGK